MKQVFHDKAGLAVADFKFDRTVYVKTRTVVG